MGAQTWVRAHNCLCLLAGYFVVSGDNVGAAACHILEVAIFTDSMTLPSASISPFVPVVFVL